MKSSVPPPSQQQQQQPSPAVEAWDAWDEGAAAAWETAVGFMKAETAIQANAETTADRRTIQE
jgi:hypothetical protein